MGDRVEAKKWVARRARQDDRLDERYGRVLEPQHLGEFVAIGPDGHSIIGADELALARQALEAFGPGAFALRRIGADAEIRWRFAPA